MELTQKRRMRKVAIAHFVLTIFFALNLLRYAAWTGPYERYIWFEAWGSFWSKVFFLFQPQLLLFDSAAKFFIRLPEWLGMLIIVGSIPVWSNCFGWIFIKLKDWLSHSPVLGKRVF